MNLDETLARIGAKIRADIDPHDVTKPFQCIRCQDTHLIEYIGGDHHVQGAGLITATPERPVYVQCRCVWERAKPEVIREF